MLAQSTDVPYWDPSLFGQEFALPPGYGTSFTVRAVEAGGMHRAASQGPIPSPYPDQIRDQGVQSPNWGASDIFRGSGGYSYQYLNDGSIKIVAGPNSVGTIVKPGTSAHTAIYNEMKAAGAVGGSGRAGAGSNVTSDIISGLTQIGVAAASAAGGAPRQAPRRGFAASGAAVPPAPPQTEQKEEESAGGFPWGIVLGGSVLVVGAVAAAFILPGLLSSKSTAKTAKKED